MSTKTSTKYILDNVFDDSNTSLENKSCSIWEKYSNIPNSETSPLELYTYLETKALPFYIEILRKSLRLKNNKKIKPNLNAKRYKSMIESIIPQNANQTYHDIMFWMIHDCFVQYHRMSISYSDAIFNEDYYSLYTPIDKAQLNQAVLTYCDKENSFNERTEHSLIDYYTDLFFFDVINRFIEE